MFLGLPHSPAGVLGACAIFVTLSKVRRSSLLAGSFQRELSPDWHLGRAPATTMCGQLRDGTSELADPYLELDSRSSTRSRGNHSRLGAIVAVFAKKGVCRGGWVDRVRSSWS